MARVRIEVPEEEKPAKQKQPVVPHAAPAANSYPSAGEPRHIPWKKLLIAAAILFGFVFVSNLIDDRNRLQEQLQRADGGSSQEADDIVKRLSESVELPGDETPQMRTIEDAAKFTEQNPSLADIKDGDVLLFFEKSQKVVIFRPSTQKAIVVVTLSQPE